MLNIVGAGATSGAPDGARGGHGGTRGCPGHRPGPSGTVRVLLTAVAFVSLAYEAANIRGTDGYELEAEFGATGGLSPLAPLT